MKRDLYVPKRDMYIPKETPTRDLQTSETNACRTHVIEKKRHVCTPIEEMLSEKRPACTKKRPQKETYGLFRDVCRTHMSEKGLPYVPKEGMFYEKRPVNTKRDMLKKPTDFLEMFVAHICRKETLIYTKRRDVL